MSHTKLSTRVSYRSGSRHARGIGVILGAIVSTGAAFADAPTAVVGGFVHLDATSPGAHWNTQDLVLCWTTTTPSYFYDHCLGHWRTLSCEQLVCRNITTGELVSESYSDECTYCLDFPECCDLDLPGVGPSDFVHLADWSLDELIDGSRLLSYLEHLSLENAFPAYGDSAAARLDHVVVASVLFTRPPEVPPQATSSLTLTITGLSLLLETATLESTMGRADGGFELYSPDLGGTLFHVDVVQPKGGLATVNGDVPVGAFDRQPGRVELVNYQVAPIEIPVPPGTMQITVEVRTTGVLRADYDRNGNDAPDPNDVVEGTSTDTNLDGVPDEVERCGLLYHALGQAMITAGSQGEMVVGNIGDSGADGCAAPLQWVRVYEELIDLPAQLPQNGRFRTSARGTYGGQSDLLFGVAQLAMQPIGPDVTLTADFTTLGADHVHVYALDGANVVADVMSGPGWQITYGLVEGPDGISWGVGPDDGPGPAIDPGQLFLAVRFLPARPVRIDNSILRDEIVVFADRVFIAPVVAPDPQARLERAAFRAENTAPFALTACSTVSVIVVGDLDCNGVVEFGDINPFVLFLSNLSAWQAAYPDCPPANGDINGDGLFPDFGDINPFVALLSGG